MVVSAQHDESVSSYQIEESICSEVIEKIIPAEYLDAHTNFTGRFVIGGPTGDCVLTRREIIVDIYGGMVVVLFLGRALLKWIDL